MKTCGQCKYRVYHEQQHRFYCKNTTTPYCNMDRAEDSDAEDCREFLVKSVSVDYNI